MKSFSYLFLVVFFIVGISGCDYLVDNNLLEKPYTVYYKPFAQYDDNSFIDVKFNGAEKDYKVTYRSANLVGDYPESVVNSNFTENKINTIVIDICDKYSNTQFHERIDVEYYNQAIILKADDITERYGNGLSENWLRFIDFCIEENISASIGIIGRSLEIGSEKYFNQLSDLIKNELFEIWNHGYDHIVSQKDENGNTYCEFRDTPYDYQYGKLLITQRLMKQIFGYKMRTFGAPGNAWDENTISALNNMKDIDVWFYGNEELNKYNLQRKHDIEFPYGRVNYTKFVEGYNQSEELYTLQIHPNMWTDDEFEQFKDIIRFLKERDVTFITAIDFYNRNKLIKLE